MFKKLLQLDLLKGGMILFIGNSIYNFGNYIFNLVMGRMLGPAEYGVLVSLVALLSIAGVPANTFLTTAMKFASSLKAQNKKDKIGFLLRLLNKYSLFLGLLLAAIFMIFSQYLSGFLKITSIYPIMVLSLSFLAIFTISTNRGILQGLQNFWGLSLTFVLEIILKISLAVVFVLLGLKSSGVLLGIFLTSILVWLFSLWFLKSYLKKSKEKFATRQLWNYSKPILLIFTILACFTYLDVVLVKHFFSPEEAGLYAGLAIIGKIVLYISMPFVGAMFPMISDRFSKNVKHYKLLAQALIIVTLLSSTVLIFFSLFPTFSINILFGSQYTQMSPYLGKFSLAILFLALGNTFINYFLSIGKTKIVWLLLFICLLEIALIWFFHSSFDQVIDILVFVFGLLFISLGFTYLLSKSRQIKDLIAR